MTFRFGLVTIFLRPPTPDFLRPSCFHRRMCVSQDVLAWQGPDLRDPQWVEGGASTSLHALTSLDLCGAQEMSAFISGGCKIAMEPLLEKENWKNWLAKHYSTWGSRNLSSVCWEEAYSHLWNRSISHVLPLAHFGPYIKPLTSIQSLVSLSSPCFINFL